MSITLLCLSFRRPAEQKKGFFGNILKQHKSLASNVLCRCTRRFEHFDICCTSIVQLAMIFVTTNNFTFRTPNLLQRRLA